jgi:hypothetical protein
MRLFQTVLFLFCLTVSATLQGQDLLVWPYLQDAQPHSIHILWETSTGEESLVEYGLDEDLGLSATGSFTLSNGSTILHQVQLSGLERFTTYYYRVVTEDLVSDIHSFRTPPFASDEQSFNLLAMSDMQKDGAHPDKFAETVNQGVLPFLQESYTGVSPDDLGFILIPGDLVVTGNNFNSWRTDFFNPGQELFTDVPLYPVLGNHENNTDNYFDYFHLPQNGTPGFEEHWWYTDYSNVRIIGLNSNPPYDGAEQLDWLSSVLAETCLLDSIDFVFAELHHPHHSELWLPGESDFTGEVITLLEDFSSNCGKPSIHFFGHTHGYSRGQSQDHKHLWVNVATAGGAIDNWGEFPQADYEEFSVSQDEYGFVILEVEAGDDPSFTLKRIGRGDEQMATDNVLRDSLTVRRFAQAPNTPTPVFPIDEEVSPDCVLLEAEDFSAQLFQAQHGASHWQVAQDCDFSNPVIDSWKQYENWYFEENTQADDDLRDEQVLDLDENAAYCWRVRYRDRELNWSPWTDPVPFTTGTSENSDNLLINPGAEAGTLGWEALEGSLEALQDGECNGISPHTGSYYFAVGGVCEDAAFGIAHQLVNVIPFADQINAGELQVNYGGYLSNWGGSDLPEMLLYFLDENGMVLDSSETLATLNASWTAFNQWEEIPVGTTTIDFTLKGTRNSGADNDSYFDDLFLRLGKETTDCSEYFVTAVNELPYSLSAFSIYPNPFSQQSIIRIESVDSWRMDIYNNLGQMIRSYQGVGAREIFFDANDLAAGLYYCRLSTQNGVDVTRTMVIIQQ